MKKILSPTNNKGKTAEEVGKDGKWHNERVNVYHFRWNVQVVALHDCSPDISRRVTLHDDAIVMCVYGCFDGKGARLLCCQK